MFIKHFRLSYQRVPDPQRPGRTAQVGRLSDSGNSGLSHGGINYEPDDNGWFDVPHDVGLDLCKFRANGSGFYEAGEVVDQVRLGALEESDQPAPPKSRRSARKPDPDAEAPGR